MKIRFVYFNFKIRCRFLGGYRNIDMRNVISKMKVSRVLQHEGFDHVPGYRYSSGFERCLVHGLNQIHDMIS